MKTINIKVGINEETEQIATVIETIGFGKRGISKELEVLGALQNVVELQKEKIKTKKRISK